ncbi:DUF6492 family protein [uncultured Tateyamaria sp.]|uniref:DUF6492 family protein n=1 Tax=uncultured Tateyamaria sp. TaxID=455651 RepID=UPI00262524B1|nr:DUF6492 family protein [uncultured Tateyamaria sp.]
MNAPSPSSRRVGLLTCSMATDIDLFALLARSVDEHVADDIRHYVVVPGADLKQFAPYRTAQREIIAQEDIMPVRLRKLPTWLRHFAFLKAGLRRPVYLTPSNAVVRGWMLQQLIKIEMSRRAEEDATMHIDSDVSFFRVLQHEDAFKGDKVRFFKAEGETKNPRHKPWVASSCRFLDVPVPDHHLGHYIENCVLWSSAVTHAMVERIEQVHDRPLHEVIFAADTMSEYYIYGIFADFLAAPDLLAPEDVSFCNSYWPSDESEAVDFDSLRARLQPKHCAMAIQSTHKLDVAERAALYQRAEKEMTRPDSA